MSKDKCCGFTVYPLEVGLISILSAFLAKSLEPEESSPVDTCVNTLAFMGAYLVGRTLYKIFKKENKSAKLVDTDETGNKKKLR